MASKSEIYILTVIGFFVVLFYLIQSIGDIRNEFTK
jgi:hypothetical protein